MANKPDLTIRIDTPWGASFSASSFLPGQNGLLVPLTPCCKATAKGLEDYIGCRKCRGEIDSAFGDCHSLDEWTMCHLMVSLILGDFYDCPHADRLARDVIAAITAEAERQTAKLSNPKD